MAVVAVLLIHMERNPVVNITPSINLLTWTKEELILTFQK